MILSELPPRKGCSLIFSKQWSFALKGLLALLIVLHHISRYLDDWYGVNESLEYVTFKQMGSINSVIVGCFFFISGYGLLVQFRRLGDAYLKSFFRRRFMKILIPFVVVTAVHFAVRYWVNPDYDIIAKMLGYLKNGEPGFINWFVPVFLYCYLVFYFSFKYIKSESQAVCACFAFVIVLDFYFIARGFGAWYWRSDLCFPLGTLYASREQKLSQILLPSFKRQFIMINGFIILVAFWDAFGKGGHYLLPLIVLLVSILMVLYTYLKEIKAVNRFIAFLSTISYELFLVHIVVLTIYNHYHETFALPMPVMVVSILSVSIILSWGLHSAFEKVIYRRS